MSDDAHRVTGPAGRFAQWGGVVYSSLAIVGFGLTGMHDFTRRSGELLLGIEVNPLLNTVHLAVGLILLAASATGAEATRIATLLAAAAFGVAGLLGLALVGTSANVLALNSRGNLVHVATAALATCSSVVASRSVGDDRQVAAGPRTP